MSIFVFDKNLGEYVDISTAASTTTDAKGAMVQNAQTIIPLMEFNPPPLDQWITLDPTTAFYAGPIPAVGKGYRKIQVTGLWTPHSSGDPSKDIWVDARGIDTNGNSHGNFERYRQLNKWCAIVLMWEPGPRGPRPVYVGGPYQIYPTTDTPIYIGDGQADFLTVQMHDDIFSDNDKHPRTPMQIMVSITSAPGG